jgi:hypothetical protein
MKYVNGIIGFTICGWGGEVELINPTSIQIFMDDSYYSFILRFDNEENCKKVFEDLTKESRKVEYGYYDGEVDD